MVKSSSFSVEFNESAERKLIENAQKGSRSAIEQLVRKHRRFVYNVALKLVGDADEADDISQEAMLKILTKLTQFNFNSNFKTWLYRIVVNHFLNTKKRKTEVETHSFEDLGVMADNFYKDEEIEQGEHEILDEEVRLARNKCMASILLCLDHQQRLVFILGTIFKVHSDEAAGILNISKDNFRKQLQRAKEDLFQFMDNKCGLINPENPCRCHKKTKAFMKEGLLDETGVRFQSRIVDNISSVVDEKNDKLDALLHGKYYQLFSSQPHGNHANSGLLIREILDDPQVKEIYDLS